MNPLASCCLYYCSGIMIVGIAFFAVLLVMLGTESRYLRPEDPYTYTDHMWAVGIAMIVSHPSLKLDIYPYCRSMPCEPLHAVPQSGSLETNPLKSKLQFCPVVR